MLLHVRVEKRRLGSREEFIEARGTGTGDGVASKTQGSRRMMLYTPFGKTLAFLCLLPALSASDRGFGYVGNWIRKQSLCPVP